jgi:hypothetical protein
LQLFKDEVNEMQVNRWFSVQLALVFSLVFIQVGCGPADDATSMPRNFGNNPNINGNSTNDHTQDVVSLALQPVTDCLHETGQCPNVYFFFDPSLSARSVQMKVNAMADPQAWTADGLSLNVPLSFACQIQTCKTTSAECNTHALEKDLAGTYWNPGTVSSITLNPGASGEVVFANTVASNKIYRAFCNYHWRLNNISATRPRIVMVTTDVIP